MHTHSSENTIAITMKNSLWILLLSLIYSVIFSRFPVVEIMILVTRVIIDSDSFEEEVRKIFVQLW